MHTKAKNRLITIWLMLSLALLCALSITLIYADNQSKQTANVSVNYDPAEDYLSKLTFTGYDEDGNETEVNPAYYAVSQKSGASGEIVIPKTYKNDAGYEAPVTHIGAFRNNAKITKVIIPNSVTIIGEYAFSNCTSLTDVTLSKNLETIGERAFGWCNIVNLTIPKSVISISCEAFMNNSDLTSIEVEEGNTNYCSVNNCLIEISSKTLKKGCNDSVIPDDGNVEIIEDGAFYNSCKWLTELIIPDGVTTIGEWAFFGCESLKSVTIGSSVETIGRKAFDYCTNLTSVTMSGSLISIGAYAFENCSSLETLDFGENCYNWYYSAENEENWHGLGLHVNEWNIKYFVTDYVDKRWKKKIII